MDIDAASRLLEIYLENSRRILRADFGVNAAESAFFDVVEHVRKYSELKEPLLTSIRETMLSNDPWSFGSDAVPLELTEVIAHEFRWPEIRQIAEERVNQRLHGDWKLATGDPAQRVLNALSPNWEDREFYIRYSRGDQ